MAALVLGFLHLSSQQAFATQFCNTATITGTTGTGTGGTGPSSPYPSPITVSGLTGTVSDVNVTLLGLRTRGDNNSPAQHWIEDADILVSAPNNANVILMSDAGGDNDISQGPVSNTNLTFDDQAANQLPADVHFTSGTYRPVDDDDDLYEALPIDVWNPPAPTLENTTLLSRFNGLSPNGVWNLWPVDDTNQAAYDMLGGWCIDILTTGGGRPPADFNGDARTDISVFRPSTGQWLSSNGLNTFFGASGDIPVPCDYNGDGTTDIAVFRPSVGGWYVNGQAPVFFGLNGDIPVPGDYNGDGRCDFAIFRSSVGGWYIQSQPTVFFGLSGDIPVPGDYNGDGITDVATFRPSVGGWYRNGAATTFFGLSGDVPVPGDYDGNRTTDVSIYRPAVGGWYRNGGATSFLGLSTDIPQPGDYDGNGTTDIAVFRPSTGAWFVGTQAPVFFGTSGDLPLPLPSAIRMATSP